jgi:hypothetical protein
MLYSASSVEFEKCTGWSYYYYYYYNYYIYYELNTTAILPRSHQGEGVERYVSLIEKQGWVRGGEKMIRQTCLKI